MENANLRGSGDGYFIEEELYKENSCIINIELDQSKESNSKNGSHSIEVQTDLHELNISSWNLPLPIVREYYSKGITKMFDWQLECLNKPKVLSQNGNLIYSAPTSAGKTLVSEILIIKTIVEKQKKALIILPYISVVREKMLYLQDILTSSGYRVEGYFGGYSPPGGFDTIDVAICTIEKANTIVNKLLEEGKIDEIGIVVVDEIHLITDPARGYLLELLLAKIIYMSKKIENNIQIIGMSATLTNIAVLRDWLDADLYITDYRPVQLNEMIKVGNKIYDNTMKFVRELPHNDVIVIENDQDNIAYLCIETILDSCSVLIFCPSKDWCETLSTHIARSIYHLCKKTTPIGTKLKKIVENNKISALQSELKNTPFGIDTVLNKSINYGCAFHHAGLTIEERDIIERNFKNGIIKIIVATSTLSSGVNLPARRVIIRSPLFGGKQMDSLTYRQMIGRAGRTGIDIIGESILICNENNCDFGKNLLASRSYNVSSCLGLENNMALKRAILEVISAGVAPTKTDLQQFLGCTLFKYEYKSLTDCESKMNNLLHTCLDFLIEYEFIRLQHNDNLNEMFYIPTQLGIACRASSLPTSDGLILMSELQKARRCFVLESDLHAVYIVTPYSACYQLQDIDWLLYIELWESLPRNLKKVGELIGVKESFLVQAMRRRTKLEDKSLKISKRFYIALALNDLINEIPLSIVVKKYNCNRGLLQNLQQTAATFAGLVYAFCKSLNWLSLALIISQFKERLYFGVHQDLIDLIKLPDLNSQRARALYNSGIVNLMDLANSDICTVENILHNCVGFETEKKFEDEDEIEANKRKYIRNIYITGSHTLTIKQAAEKFILDARKYLEFEIGAKNIEWTSTKRHNANLQDSLSSKIYRMEINGKKLNLENICTHTSLEKENSISNSRQNINVRKETRDLLVLNSSQHGNSFNILDTKKSETKPISFNCVLIIDICGNINLFQNALIEISEAKVLGFSVNCQKIPTLKKALIGANLYENLHAKPNISENIFDFTFDNHYFISGISISLGNNASYFLNMQKVNTCPNISKTMKLKALQDIVDNKDNTLRILNAKQQLKMFLKAFPSIYIQAKIEDPKIANWLLQPDHISTLRQMAKLYAPECYALVDLIPHKKSHLSKLESCSFISLPIRSSVESCIAYQMLSNQLENLTRIANGHLKKYFYEIEMPIQKSLIQMENFGFAVNTNAITHLIQEIRKIMCQMEDEAYKLHGSHFNLSCTTSVAKILGIPKNANGRYCTTKVVLKKIDSILSNLIMSYRKLSTTLDKTLMPLLKNLHNDRILGNSSTLTLTGRIVMTEPNLQNVPKDYEVSIPKKRLISCRRLFICRKGTYLVSADFRQVEIRILAHLSQDSVLKQTIHSKKDLFTSLAAKWSNISEEYISKEIRNKTKQICYAIIYGMGCKSLSESLNCTEEEALFMSEQFHKSYPGVRIYLNKIIKFAEKNGYIETVTGRRRYLNNINNTNLCLKNEAERRAINSTIQGSAADIFKSAMLRMEKNVIKYNRKLGINFKKEHEFVVNLVHHIHDELIYEVPENNVNNVVKILKTTMENCVILSVPLEVNIKTGKSWGNMQDI